MTPISVFDWQMVRDLALLAPHIKPTTGNVFFVHSGTGSSTNAGTSTTAPLSTIDLAINKCSADHGDVVVAMPGHAETITTALQLILDVAGVSIVGLGQGATRPVITFTAVGANIPISAANCLISNLVFRAGIASVVAGITISNQNCEINNCLFDYSDTTLFSFVAGVLTTAAADHLYIHDSVFHSEVSATPTSVGAIELVGVDRPRVLNNTFIGSWTFAPIYVITTLCTMVNIGCNVIYNSYTVAARPNNGINSVGLNSTGIVWGNRVSAMYAQTNTKLIGTSTWTGHDNTCVNAISECSGANIVHMTASSA